MHHLLPEMSRNAYVKLMEKKRELTHNHHHQNNGISSFCTCPNKQLNRELIYDKEELKTKHAIRAL